MSYSPSIGLRAARALALAAAVTGFTAAPATAAFAPRVVKAGYAVKVADRKLVKQARVVARCGNGCPAQRLAVQRAGRRLAMSSRRMTKVARAAATAAPTASQVAPLLSVSGQTLTWNRVARVSSYVLARKVPGQAATYSLVTGLTTVPSAAPGSSVTYAVRTAVNRSRWSADRTITYPAPTSEGSAAPAPAPASAPASAPAPSAIDAPVMRIDGQSVTWSRVAAVDDYVLVTKVPETPDAYRVVRGTSTTPPVVAGKRVRYSVRTAVEGSAWAPEAWIDYPAAAPAPAPAPSPSPAPSGFVAGIVAGSAHEWELPFIQKLSARTARLEFSIDTPVSAMETTIEKYAAAGVRPLLLAGFDGRTVSESDALNLARWAAAYGPGGTFWATRSFPSSVVPRTIEFGNETSYGYQYSELNGDPNWATSSTYKAVAARYALRFRDAAVAIEAANPAVGLLAINDSPGNWATWMDTLFATVPRFADHVAGWTVHPYGPNWQGKIDNSLAQARSHGAPESIPVHVTEFGFSSDDGRCLSDNYGWDKCMSYDTAGRTLTSAVAAMRSRYGSRLASIYLYQAHDQRNPVASQEREGYFGALHLDGSSKGTYTTAAQTFLAG